MNTTITATITPEERIDLQRLRDRILSESHDRIVQYFEPKGPGGVECGSGWRFTETSMEAIRILPVIDRLLNSPSPEVITTGGIVKPTPARLPTPTITDLEAE